MHAFGTISCKNLAPIFFFSRLKPLIYIGLAFIQQALCTVCDYVYDPEIGDPDGGIAPGTPVDDIPDDWLCPVCSAAKSDFELYEE